MSSIDTRSAEQTSLEDPITVAVSLGVPIVRIEIVKFLRSQPATISQIASAVGRTRYGMQSHLDILERLGAITHVTQKVRGSFRPARLYRVNPSGVEALAWCLFDALADDIPGAAA
ncbi:winged helix-turn-helix domain-containing protein [Microbacterium sp. PRC9]|uniref:winged helix-turn-helix domain-containing protein n=1 Tax=Microbacterium sp. PRC9 TaxID=2962591 RepID=UPI0028825C75|nr:winged helix-turn-helix domain-containing protein [Microbacterium sp. PRC9]MDT0144568.1 winged helix-turn-helix domain-containing protein [Microbacterium sp. PRC9]